MDTTPSKSRLQHQQQQEQTAEQQMTSQQQTYREFATVEDLLRHDAGQTVPPPVIAERLKTSLEQEERPESRQSWWRRLLARPSANP
jgi:hypothetical protein